MARFALRVEEGAGTGGTVVTVLVDGGRVAEFEWAGPPRYALTLGACFVGAMVTLRAMTEDERSGQPLFDLSEQFSAHGRAVRTLVVLGRLASENFPPTEEDRNG